MAPLVSIIVPFFNAELTIERCVNSIVRQTYNNIQIILVDNNSSDSTRSIITAHFNQDNIEVYHCPKQGVSFARNLGSDHARGEFICFLDADDELLPSSIEDRVEILEKNEANLVASDYIRVSKYGKTKPVGRIKMTLDSFTWGNPIGNLTGMYRVVQGDKYFQENIHHEDYEMWFRIARNNKNNIVYLPSVTAVYHVTPNSISSNLMKNLKGHSAILYKFYGFSPKFFLGLLSYSVSRLIRRLI